MMRYEIIEMDGLQVVFKGSKMVAAYETIEKAKQGIERDRKQADAGAELHEDVIAKILRCDERIER